MKKALVMTFVLVLGLGFGLAAQTVGGDFSIGNLSGSWETIFSIGLRDVTLTEAAYTIHTTGDTYPVSQGAVTISEHTVTISTLTGTMDVTVPEAIIPVGPYCVELGTRDIFFDCDDDTITVCEGTGTFYGHEDCNGTGTSFTVPREEDIPVDFGTVTLTYGGTYLFTNIATGQTASVTLTDSVYVEDRSVLCCCDPDSIDFVLPELHPVIPASIVSSGDDPTFVIASETATYNACTTWTTAPSAVRSDVCGGCNGYTVDLTSTYPVVVTKNTFTTSGMLISGVTDCENDCVVPVPPCEYDLADITDCENPSIDLRTFHTAIGGIWVPSYDVTIMINGAEVTLTVPAQGPYYVSDQTVTIPDLDVLVHGWSKTIEKIPTLAFTSTLIVDYTVGGWVFNSTSKFANTGWTAQSFAAVGSLGAFGFTSDLVFDPVGAAFTSWNNTASLSLAGVSFDTGFLLEADGAGWTFGVSGSAGVCSLAATVYLNTELDADGNLVVIGDIFCFCFSSVEFDISFPFACIELVDISLAFSETGFDGITFAATGVAVPGISFLTLDVELTFDDGTLGKTLSITPTLNIGTDCIIIYGELVTGAHDWQIIGVNIYGVGLEYTWNGVTFASYSSLDPDHNEDLTGNADYWEVFSISSEADSCCGGLFDFGVDTYFESGSAALFDFGEMEATISVGLGSNYTFGTGLVVSDTAFEAWTVSFKVTW